MNTNTVNPEATTAYMNNCGQLSRIGMPVLAAVAFLAVLGLGVIAQRTTVRRPFQDRMVTRVAAGLAPAHPPLMNNCGQLSRIGMPVLAAVVFLAILGLGAVCWIINSGDRSDRMNRMMLASRGDAKCLKPDTSASSSPSPTYCPSSVR